MGFFTSGGREFQVAGDAFLKARSEMLFGVDCCFRSRAVEKRNIFVFGYCWMKLHK